MEDLEEKDTAKGDVTDSSSYKSAPSHLSPESITCGNDAQVVVVTFKAEWHVSLT